MKTGKTKEKPKVMGTRGYTKHHNILKRWARVFKTSHSDINRIALEEFDASRSKMKKNTDHYQQKRKLIAPTQENTGQE